MYQNYSLALTNIPCEFGKKGKPPSRLSYCWEGIGEGAADDLAEGGPVE